MGCRWWVEGVQPLLASGGRRTGPIFVLQSLLRKAKALSFAFGDRVTFSWSPRESNQSEGDPPRHLPGYARQVREPRPGFSTGLLPWRKGIGIHADAPTGLIVHGSLPHKGVEIKIKIKIKGNRNSNSHSSGYRLTASPQHQHQHQHRQQRKGDGDRVSDCRAFARDARGF